MDLQRELEREKNPEVLRQFSILAFKAADRYRGLYEAKCKEQEEELRQLQNDLGLKIQLTSLRKILFGKSSEKQGKKDRKRERENDQLLMQAQSLAPPPKEEEKVDLPQEEMIHTLTEETLKPLAKKRGLKHAPLSAWKAMPGFFETHKEITIIERRIQEVIHKRQKYHYKENTDIIITAPGPQKLLPGCTYSLDFSLGVVSDKFLYHLPYERQRCRFEELGLKVSVKTLTGLAQMVAVHMESVLPAIKKDIFESERTIGIDETPWPILNKKDDDGYLWSMSNQAGTVYQFEPTRSGLIAAEMLKGYRGSVMSDRFGGYNRLEKMSELRLAHCWAHARRKFIEIEEYYPQETKEILGLIRQLFKNERGAKTWQQLRQIREEESTPLIQEIYDWLIKMKTHHLRESGMQSACNYLLKHWDRFKIFLKDERIPLSNNDTERALRHAVMGRKNSYGSKTINGADVLATLYTVIETCKKMELNLREYIRYVIEENNKKKLPLSPMAYARKIRAH